MKNHFEHFQAFIEEQKKWFEQHLSADFAQTWNDHIWVSGNQVDLPLYFQTPVIT